MHTHTYAYQQAFAEISGAEIESSGLVAVFTEGIDESGADDGGKATGRRLLPVGGGGGGGGGGAEAEASIGLKRTANMVEQLIGSRAMSPTEGEGPQPPY